ncbi:hypothetical protein AVEN_185015-1 [Araneus ventricosus]|uniref:Transposable element Tcb1 transposase n=1 Tax=Araneus ventricosus TaxID=182803 RepID=A0A4Y2BQV4_ARAVE|nr:hypothetical protein AVEN_185015-1 [Araneus ventricosus]
MGMFSSKLVGEIMMVNFKMTVSMYVDILSENLKKSVINLSVIRRHTFERDNDPNHTSHIAKNYFSKNKIKALEWHRAQTLTPSKVYGQFQIRNCLLKRAKTKSKFFETIRDKWCCMNQEKMQKLVDSLNQRLMIVIEAKGGPDKH